MLPYPGYSWSMTQHIGRAATPEILFELLRGAFTYRNMPRYETLINQYVLETGFLPDNVREDAGRSQIWRDYQQILPELGMMTSIRFTEGPEISSIGLMWLDGAIGYSEAVTTQCLTYQYPNGHKQDISPALRRELQDNGIHIPRTRTELDVQHGVLIKPAVLILRILLELLRNGDPDPQLSVNECLLALVPTKRNSDWPEALQRLMAIRNLPLNRNVSSRAKRHVQEWFRLLSFSDIFRQSPNRSLGLRANILQDLEDVTSLCEYHERPEKFWVPLEFQDTNALGRSWFDYYGNPDIGYQWFMPNYLQDEEYIGNNYLDGIEEEETVVTDSTDILNHQYNINLQEFRTGFMPPRETTYTVDLERIRQGHERRQSSSLLHEKIVETLANKLGNAGCMVHMDRQSVDLFTEINGEESIFEVKTINKKNWVQRLRLGVGQLSEYRYRRYLETRNRPRSILVISGTYNFPEWMLNYFSQEVNIGLISHSPSGNFHSHTDGLIESFLMENN
jgi:hypothetical protein